MKFLKERALQFSEPFRTATLAIDDDLVLPIDRGQQWKPIAWDNRGGKITLAGDAAHCMLPRMFLSPFLLFQIIWGSPMADQWIS